ncbi:MAG: hypothetical protein EON93_16475 [Burkholderiales bacterium]|nr:MAG: hypothetical protein EON93_16475 [Burkholderiales bacterium]
MILLLLYGASLRRWSKMRSARFGYAFLQLYDDIMDGDRPCAETPEHIATLTMAEWKSGVFIGDSDLSRLGKAFHQSLGDANEAKCDTLILLGLMHEDYARRTERRLSSRAVLEKHLRDTFFHSVNLLFHGCGLKTRADGVPALVEALAWCSVVRDFADDARKGLFNVPREIAGNVATQDIPDQPAVKAWLENERARGPELLQECEIERQAIALTDPQAAKLSGVFAKSMRKYCST